MPVNFKSVLAALAATILCSLGTAAAASADSYVSLGDSSSTSSSSGGASMYPDLLFGGYGSFPGFGETLGADEHVALAQAGQVLAGLKAEQLPQALAAINDPDDTKAVTLAIGANDALGADDPCFGEPSGCAAWQASYDDLVAQIRNALDNDPGDEFFGLMSYYNPFRWDGSGISPEDQQHIDLMLFGANLIPDQCAVEVSTGVNDIVRQAGSKYGAVVADPYQAFLDANGSFLADSIHANAAGNAAIADAFLDPVQPVDCDPPPEPTCETDPSLCPPEPSCETDQSLCPPDPTCETDPSLCPTPKDKVAPKTRLISMKRLGRRSVAFRFRSNEAGSFRCSIDGRRFRRCASPKVYRRLTKGRHVFRVRAVDKAGNVDRSPVRRVFRIKR
ncbi:MAG: hypothetical protein J0H66_09525 [Solirubrobacterales bacterium]|nr:hypothetical protein [Solirubrobacterales bacterium]